MHRRTVGVWAGVLLTAGLSACGNGTAPASAAEQLPQGLFSVTLTGVLTDRYEANGGAPLGPRRDSATFSLASNAVAGRYLVLGYRARGTDRQDMLALNVRGVTGPGEYPMIGSFLLGMPIGGHAFPEAAYTITAGTVRISTLSASRLAGEFSGVAVPNIVTIPPVPPADTVHLSAGSFDVPIANAISISSSRAVLVPSGWH